MKTKTALLPLTLGMLVAVLPAQAHHSFAAQYDAAKPITLTGKVTKIEWTNPHIYIFMDVPDEKKTGAAVNWALEMGSPNALIRLGWKRDSLKPDDMVTVEGLLAKDGSHVANAKSIVLTATGKKMLAGSSGGTGGASSSEER
ncbi:MAG: DUF6152 family protein [Gammaproteobacteria bacterium]